MAVGVKKQGALTDRRIGVARGSEAQGRGSDGRIVYAGAHQEGSAGTDTGVGIRPEGELKGLRTHGRIEVTILTQTHRLKTDRGVIRAGIGIEIEESAVFLGSIVIPVAPVGRRDDRSRRWREG